MNLNENRLQVVDALRGFAIVSIMLLLQGFLQRLADEALQEGTARNHLAQCHMDRI